MLVETSLKNNQITLILVNLSVHPDLFSVIVGAVNLKIKNRWPHIDICEHVLMLQPSSGAYSTCSKCQSDIPWLRAMYNQPSSDLWI